MLPGDLAQAKLGIEASPEALAQTRTEFGLNDSLILQFVKWLGNALSGDLGVSMLTGANIAQEIVNKATVTLPLIGLASVLALVFILPLKRPRVLHRATSFSTTRISLSPKLLLLVSFGISYYNKFHLPK